MKKVLLILLLALPAFAQNSRYDSVALGPRGPIPNATVAVCTQPANTTTTPCSPLANLCSSLSDATCTSPNPVTADSLGNYHFYGKPGQGPFTLQLYGPQVAAPLVLPDQTLGGSGSSITVRSLNNILFADQFAGADMCAKIVAAFSAVPSTGGIVDGRGFQGAQTCASNPLSTAPAGSVLLLGPAQITTSAQWIAPPGVEVIGSGRSNTTGTVIRANASTFPINTAVAQEGDGVNITFGTRFENLVIDCNSVTGCTCLSAIGIDEQSGGSLLLLGGFKANGLKIDGTSIIAANWSFEDIELYSSSTSTSVVGVQINNNNAAGTLRRITSISLSAAQGATGVLVSASTPYSGMANLERIHCENYTDCVKFDTNSSGSAFAIDGSTGAGPVTNVLHIVTSKEVSASHISGVSATHALVDDVAAVTMNNVVGFYTTAPSGIRNNLSFGEGTPTGAATGIDICQGSSGAHAMQCSYNNGTFLNMPQVIGSGTATMTTAAIVAGNCGTTVTVAATGVATTDTITWAFNAAPAGSNAGLVAWPTANNVNFAYCPNTAETPAAATINWRVVR